MKVRSGNKAINNVRARKQRGPDVRHRDADSELRNKRGATLGLRAFEKISAVEGIRLSGEMLEDLRLLETRHMDELQRSRFIAGKYGQK